MQNIWEGLVFQNIVTPMFIENQDLLVSYNYVLLSKSQKTINNI